MGPHPVRASGTALRRIFDRRNACSLIGGAAPAPPGQARNRAPPPPCLRHGAIHRLCASLVSVGFEKLEKREDERGIGVLE
jgi:hypothetical protein